MLEMWILWGCLSGFVALYAVRAVRDPVNIFSPALIVSLLVFGTLVKSYFEFDALSLAMLLDENYYIVTMIFAVLCLLVYCFCYERGLRDAVKMRRIDQAVETLPVGVITACVTLIGVVGVGAQWLVAAQAGGLVAFYSKPHGSAVDYTAMSAYLYALPNFMWSALLIGLVTWGRTRGASKYLLLVTVAIGILLLAHTYLFGNRNGVIRVCLILGGAYTFIRRPSFLRSLPIVACLVAGIAIVLVIANIRDSLHLAADKSVYEAVSTYFESVDQNGGYKQVNWRAGGHELFFNVAVVQAASVTGTYDFGLPYLYPFINFVPRAFWSDKPYELDFGVNYFQLVESVAGWSPGTGAAISAIGYTFLSFSWFGCLLWGVLGFYSGHAVRRAREDSSLMNLGFLVACLIGNVYWGTQGYTAIFFGWFFTVAPFYGLRLLAFMRDARIQQSASMRAARTARESAE